MRVTPFRELITLLMTYLLSPLRPFKYAMKTGQLKNASTMETTVQCRGLN